MALCAGILLATGAANADSTQPDAASVNTEQDVEALLKKVEQQISVGHTMYPAGDCAIDTWKQVLQQTTSPNARSQLADFVTHMRSRAIDELTAGRKSVANDTSIFATQASHIVWHTVPPVNSPNAAARPVPRSESPPAPDTPKTELFSGPVTTASPAPANETRLPPPADMPPDPNATPEQLRLAADRYATRGDEMLAANDIPAARRFYGYAAIAGSARSAIALAGTYDPNFTVAKPAKAPVTKANAVVAERDRPPREAHRKRRQLLAHRVTVVATATRVQPPFFERIFNNIRGLLNR